MHAHRCPSAQDAGIPAQSRQGAEGRPGGRPGAVARRRSPRLDRPTPAGPEIPAPGPRRRPRARPPSEIQTVNICAQSVFSRRRALRGHGMMPL
ncbi:MAG: hypothetical protein ACK559_32205, partial [bacterium]